MNDNTIRFFVLQCDMGKRNTTADSMRTPEAHGGHAAHTAMFLKEWHLPWSPLSIMESPLSPSPTESSVYHGVPSLMEQSLAWRPLSWRPLSHGVLSLMESSLSWNPLSHVAISLMRVISLMESSLSWGPLFSSYGDPLSHAIIMHTGEICYKPKEATI